MLALISWTRSRLTLLCIPYNFHSGLAISVSLPPTHNEVVVPYSLFPENHTFHLCIVCKLLFLFRFAAACFAVLTSTHSHFQLCPSQTPPNSKGFHHKCCTLTLHPHPHCFCCRFCHVLIVGEVSRMSRMLVALSQLFFSLFFLHL